MHLAAVQAVESVLGSGYGPGLSIFIEGEEESGSPTLSGMFKDHGSELRAQAAIVADSGSWKVRTPALTASSGAWWMAPFEFASSTTLCIPEHMAGRWLMR